jgi:hypothetical protein
MYRLDRTKFINWICTSCFFEQRWRDIKDDLIKGSEYVVTAQDFLDNIDNIPSFLVDEADTILQLHVRNDECELYYNPKTKAE